MRSENLSDSDKNSSSESDTQTRSELRSKDDEWLDNHIGKPLTTREYFKLWGYGVLGLLAVGVFIFLLFNYID